MNINSARGRIILVACAALLVSLALASTALATTRPHLTIAPLAQSATSTTYTITLTNHGDVFNVVEFALNFASTTTLEATSIESALCRPELVIANTISTSTNTWYVACGTFIPFSGATTTLATFTLTGTPLDSQISFGTSTSLYRHDGLGTQIIPTTTVSAVAPTHLTSTT